MRVPAFIALCAAALAGCGSGAEREVAAAPTSTEESALRFTLDRLDGTQDDLSNYEGKVVLVVNTASRCGFTPQFEGLQRLYEAKKDDGLVLLGFPANDFAGQEPLDNEAIGEFCTRNFGVSFPMFAKIGVTGEDAHPLFKTLGEPDWNFNKYLLDREGKLVKRWGATTAPDDPELTGAIEEQLRL